MVAAMTVKMIEHEHERDARTSAGTGAGDVQG
jgi:hypothetical protein